MNHFNTGRFLSRVSPQPRRIPHLFSVTLLAIFGYLFPPPVHSQTIPSFPTCENPQGTQIARYTSGIHGIPGDSKTYTGSDIVYSIDGKRQVLQCFCSSTGEGIETHWLNIPQAEPSEISSFINSGWTYIPDGAFWGLNPSTYFAINRTYSCQPRGGAITASSNGSGSVLGLATTGTTHIALSFLAIGIVFLFLGKLLKSRSH